MRIFPSLLVIIAFFSISTGISAQQPAKAVPPFVRFNGQYLHTDQPGEAGALMATFTIYRDENSWTALWSEVQEIHPDKDGTYSVMLGSASSAGIPADLFVSGEPRWLEVEINQTKQPRVALVSVPYALKAADADTLGGLPASAYLRASSSSATGAAALPTTGSLLPHMTSAAVIQPNVASGSANYLAMFSDSSNLVSSTIYQSGNTVSVGATDSLGALTLIGNVPQGDASGMALYNAGGGGGASVSLDFYNTWANGGIPQAKIKAVDDGNYSDNLTFWTKTPGSRYNAVGEKMRITSTGSVGIGTTNPQQLLEVNGNVMVDGSITVSGGLVAPGSVGPSFQSANDSSYNVAAGIGALPPSTTGKQNTAAGYAALGTNTTGGNNTAVGKQALGANTTGSSNTAVGNIALSANTTGSNNTVVGQQALAATSAGVGNTAIGTGSLLFNQSGSYNIAIGYQSGAYLFNGSQNIYIGQVAAGQAESATIRIGNSFTQNATYIAGIRGVTTAVNNAIPVFIDTNGQLGTISSSRRFKEDIQDMGDASAGLLRLRPVTFRYKKPFADGSKPIQYGLIAEEVAEVYPDLVAHSADGQIETVKYQVLDAMLLNEVQRLHAQNAAQADKIQELEQRLSRLEAAISVK